MVFKLSKIIRKVFNKQNILLLSERKVFILLCFTFIWWAETYFICILKIKILLFIILLNYCMYKHFIDGLSNQHVTYRYSFKWFLFPKTMYSKIMVFIHGLVINFSRNQLLKLYTPSKYVYVYIYYVKVN